MSFRLSYVVLVLFVALGTSGCMVSKGKYNAILSKSRVLSEQNRAQLAEVENLKIHTRHTEDQLKSTEEELALLQDRFGLEPEKLASIQDAPESPLKSAPIAPVVANRLIFLSDEYPHLRFDPNTGIAKVDVDIVFESGSDRLRPAARRLLQELAEVLNCPEGADLRIMVAGHTDDQVLNRHRARKEYPTNFHLSSSRALVVAGELEDAGIDLNRVAVAGFGGSQPVAPNTDEANRSKNRRVEIFVMAPNVPVIGWTETISTAYR
jgi:chemotaxis protein MotB